MEVADVDITGQGADATRSENEEVRERGRWLPVKVRVNPPLILLYILKFMINRMILMGIYFARKKRINLKIDLITN